MPSYLFWLSQGVAWSFQHATILCVLVLPCQSYQIIGSCEPVCVPKKGDGSFSQSEFKMRGWKEMMYWWWSIEWPLFSLQHALHLVSSWNSWASLHHGGSEPLLRRSSQRLTSQTKRSGTEVSHLGQQENTHPGLNTYCKTLLLRLC